MRKKRRLEEKLLEAEHFGELCLILLAGLEENLGVGDQVYPVLHRQTAFGIVHTFADGGFSDQVSAQSLHVLREHEIQESLRSGQVVGGGGSAVAGTPSSGYTKARGEPLAAAASALESQTIP